MPSIKFHTSRSLSPPATAKKIHEALDNIHNLPFFTKEVHGKWRKLTHNVPTAAFIGYTLGGRKGMIDALNHIKDDLLYNKLFYERDKEREREREVTKMIEEAESEG